MVPHSRRAFVTRWMAGLAGGALLTHLESEALVASAEAVAAPEEGFREEYWRLVQRGFRLEPGLVYLNNASLGPSPELVSDTTEVFRRRLDAFPSRYMWGGWSEDKETVRSKCAALLGADAEEIALGLQYRGSGGPAGRGVARGCGDDLVVTS